MKAVASGWVGTVMSKRRMRERCRLDSDKTQMHVQTQTTSEATQTAASAHNITMTRDCFQSTIKPPRAGSNNLLPHTPALHVLFFFTLHSGAELITY